MLMSNYAETIAAAADSITTTKATRAKCVPHASLASRNLKQKQY